jgi:hypothetical protein
MAIQEPKVVPTIYKAYEKEYPYKIWSYMVQYLHILDPEIPIDIYIYNSNNGMMGSLYQK